MIEKVMTRSIVGWLTVIISVHFESSVLKRTPPLSSQLPFEERTSSEAHWPYTHKKQLVMRD
jgi:hypothetical protein